MTIAQLNPGTVAKALSGSNQASSATAGTSGSNAALGESASSAASGATPSENFNALFLARFVKTSSQSEISLVSQGSATDGASAASSEQSNNLFTSSDMATLFAFLQAQGGTTAANAQAALGTNLTTEQGISLASGQANLQQLAEQLLRGRGAGTTSTPGATTATTGTTTKTGDAGTATPGKTQTENGVFGTLVGATGNGSSGGTGTANIAADSADAAELVDFSPSLKGAENAGNSLLAASHAASTANHANAAGLAPAAAPATTAVSTPVGSSGWSEEFSQKITWIAKKDLSSAELTLNPPNLGPVEISLQTTKEGTTAQFASPHAEVRDAIESALPRLKEMLANAGIDLTQTNVGSESFRQSQQQAQAQFAQSGNDQRQSRGWDESAILRAGSGSVTGTEETSGVTVRRGNGLVDLFA